MPVLGSTASTAPETRRAVRNTLFGAMVGTAVEWYDFYLHAPAAAAVFNRLFFPSYSYLTGTLLAYATFAIGFFVRPVVSVVFGRLGDRIGRKRVLVITLLLMGGSTTAMGLLPTYAQAGLWAPVLLTLLRAMQGFGSARNMRERSSWSSNMRRTTNPPCMAQCPTWALPQACYSH